MITHRLRQHEVTLMHEAADQIDELIEALTSCLRQMANPDPVHRAYVTAQDKACAAIAKAKGENG